LDNCGRPRAPARARHLIIAVNGDAALGVAAFDGKQARSVFVRSDWHGKGIGASLLRTLEALARETDLMQLSLLSSVSVVGFYERQGYQRVGDVIQGEERTVRMQKPPLCGDPALPQSHRGLAVCAMCGLAFSGKSTAARRVAGALGLGISLDAINRERGLHGGEGMPDERWEETSFIAMARLRECLQQGNGAIVDDTFSHRFVRDRCRRVAESCGATFTILFLDTPLPVIQARRAANSMVATRDPIGDDVFEHHRRRFEVIETDELAVRITCDGDLDRWIAGFHRPR
jgi:predicted kinase